MKYTRHKNRLVHGALAVFVALSVMTLAPSVSAKNYINWGNKYYFHVPDDWRQIERFNVENFLQLHGKNPADVPYDAFFCPKDAEPFWSKAYLFVTTEKAENSFSQADSLLRGMAAEFDKMVKSEDALGPITRVKSRKPKLDRKAKTITQLSNLNVQGQEQVLKLVMKFHKTGITTFYFYCIADSFKTFEPDFNEMVNSFSDENLDKAEAAGKVIIVDVSASDTESAVGQTTDDSSPAGDSDSSTGNYTIYIVGAILALFVYIFIGKGRRQGGGG